MIEFRTAGYDKVCEKYQGLEQQDNEFVDGIYTLEQARGLLPVHLRCRCAWLPVLISIRPVSNILATQPRGRFIEVRDPKSGKLLFRYDP